MFGWSIEADGVLTIELSTILEKLLFSCYGSNTDVVGDVLVEFGFFT